MHCYVRKSSIYPSTAQCLTIHHTCWPPFLGPISVQFLIRMSLQKPTHINGMSCCMYNFISTHKTSATAMLLQWTNVTNRTIRAQTQFRLHCEWCKYVVLWCVVTVVWKQGSKLGACTVMSKRVQMQWYYTKNLWLLWRRGGFGTIITICENKDGLYKTNNKEIVKFCVFTYPNVFSPSWAQIIRIFL
jgi:hypothetical protein